MIKTKTNDEFPRLHIKKIDFTREYIDFCYSHAVDKGEVHHVIPKVILEKRIANKMTVKLSASDHITAHWLLTLSLIQRRKFDIIQKIGYSKPLVVSDSKYRNMLVSYVRFAVKDTNEWRTAREIYNDIIVADCHKHGYLVPEFKHFENKLMSRACLSKSHLYFRNWNVYVF